MINRNSATHLNTKQYILEGNSKTKLLYQDAADLSTEEKSRSQQFSPLMKDQHKLYTNTTPLLYISCIRT